LAVRYRYLLVGLIALAAVAWPLPRDPAFADDGVSVNLGAVTIDDALSPGGRYRLPTLTVTNIGDTPNQYEVVIVGAEDSGARNAPPGWFEVSPASFHLAQHAEQQVQLRIALPANAKPDRYMALIEAHSVPGGGGIHISAAAASRITFHVKSSTTIGAYALRMRRWFGDHSPWSYTVPALILAVCVLAVARRNLRVGVRIERRH
jgi:hypothetical protein